jgi:ubiquinone/menaquinone biosynthesis C-methylase UbiE
MSISLDLEHAVTSRYSDAAQTQVPELCCPVTYDPQYLQIIPGEIKERDYGCGNPAEFVREGDRVLDLGSGGGKICYIAAQIVGPKGRVIGVDMNDEMLALAEKYRSAISETLGYSNVEFHKGRIQELSPLLADKSVDVVLSNCVLNLVRPEDKEQLFAEMFRVVTDGGRVAISDIVSDVDVPEEMQRNPELWSGCISGAFQEDRFLQAFENAGFHQAKMVKRDEAPWQVVQGIEFRAVTVLAFKDEAGAKAEMCCC